MHEQTNNKLKNNGILTVSTTCKSTKNCDAHLTKRYLRVRTSIRYTQCSRWRLDCSHEEELQYYTRKSSFQSS